MEQTVRRCQDSHQAVYGTDTGGRFTAEQIGEAAALDILGTRLGIPCTTDERRDAEARARQEAERLIKDKGLDHLDADHVRLQAARAVQRLLA